MRKQRMGLIQTHDQLKFSYIAILQGAYQILGREAFPEFEDLEEDEVESEEEESDDSSKYIFLWWVIIRVLPLSS